MFQFFKCFLVFLSVMEFFGVFQSVAVCFVVFLTVSGCCGVLRSVS